MLPTRKALNNLPCTATCHASVPRGHGTYGTSTAAAWAAGSRPRGTRRSSPPPCSSGRAACPSPREKGSPPWGQGNTYRLHCRVLEMACQVTACCCKEQAEAGGKRQTRSLLAAGAGCRKFPWCQGWAGCWPPGTRRPRPSPAFPPGLLAKPSAERLQLWEMGYRPCMRTSCGADRRFYSVFRLQIQTNKKTKTTLPGEKAPIWKRPKI